MCVHEGMYECVYVCVYTHTHTYIYKYERAREGYTQANTHTHAPTPNHPHTNTPRRPRGAPCSGNAALFPAAGFFFRRNEGSFME